MPTVRARRVNRIRDSIDPRHRSRRGQALVEFALVLPILMLILLSIMQLGFLFSGHIGMINGVREAARYGSLAQTTDSTSTANRTAVRTYMSTVLLPRNVPGYASGNLRAHEATYCKYQNPSGTAYSVRLAVSATYAHPLFIPMVGVILDGFDGAIDAALAVGTTEYFRVENPPLNSSEVSVMPTCA